MKINNKIENNNWKLQFDFICSMDKNQGIQGDDS